MSERTLLIIGAGGHGKAVAEAALLSGNWQRIVFADDRWPELKEWAGWPVVAKGADIVHLRASVQGAIAAIGNNGLRSRFVQVIDAAGFPLVSIIHPRAYVSDSALLGAGVTVMACAMVGTDARVGKAAIVNASATVDHDAALGDFAHLGVGVQLAGGVRIGARAWLQAGCCAGYGVKVADDAVLAPGAILQAI